MKLQDIFEDDMRGNPLPPKESNWYEFAKTFDIGVLDLDNLAYHLGFKSWRDLDMSISPVNLYTRDKKKFVRALRSASGKADMAPSDDAIVDVILSLRD